MGRKVVVAVVGFLVGLVMAVSLGVAGLRLPLGVPVVVGLLFAAAFFFIPDVDARTAAARRRKEFKRALGAYLDWVSLQMSGKAAAEQALPDAAKIGSGWPLALIRHTVTNATRSGQDVWVAFQSSVTGSAWRSCASSARSCSWSPTTARRSATPCRRARPACVTRSWPTPRAPPANATSRC